MILTKLRLINFRNHADLRLDLSPLTVFIGPNAAGKTNIIEAVEMLATTRPYRASRDRDVITWGASSAWIEGEVIRKDGPATIAITIVAEPVTAKAYKVNDVPKRSIELLETLQTVLFSPESLDFVYGAPALRRRFLDVLLSQVDRRYARTLWQYNQIIRERNKLLSAIFRNLSACDELAFWDEKLVELGTMIIECRRKAVDFFTVHLPGLYKDISGKEDKLAIHYRLSIEPALFMETLRKERDREVRTGATLFGPHRDDLILTLNGHPLAGHGSRGEVRSAMLSLKLAEVSYHSDKYGEPPILLLDDIFSELDAERRSRLAKIVDKQQTLITTTDLDHLDQSIREKAQIVELSKLSK